MSRAIVLINIGTPEAPTPQALGHYLREFLSDPKVLQKPFWLRWFLVNVVIVPRRKYASAGKYQKIWTEAGSPLWTFSKKLAQQVQRLTDPRDHVMLAMRYGSPSFKETLEHIRKLECDEVFLVPLFPQYAESTHASAAAEWERLWRSHNMNGRYQVLEPFYEEDFFIQPQVELAREHLKGRSVDHYIFSYHGLPEKHLRETEPSKGHCLKADLSCCADPRALPRCYRAQCLRTSQKLAEGLQLEGPWTMSFQSRLGPEKWLTPSTESVALEQARKGARVAVLSPSFVVDGLETLEEIGLDLKDQFLKAGGKEFILVPCLNDNLSFAQGLVQALGKGGGRNEASPTGN